MSRYQFTLIGTAAIASLVDSYSVAQNQGEERQQVLIAVGAPGKPKYGSMFKTWADRWKAAANTADAGVCVIGQDEANSDRKLLARAITRWTSEESREPLWIVLIGHGTFDGRTARFNLRGPDITATEIADLLQDSKRPIALINCCSSSAPFINAVSGPNRVVITATKDGGQFQLARFGDGMSAAIGGKVADLNQDGQVSLLEAWILAARRTDEFYESNGRLATEHSLLDDNGDGLGSRVSVYDGVQLRVTDDSPEADGSLARRWHLIRSSEERQLSVEQRERRDELETRLEKIRQHRDDHTDPKYLDELESVLLPLARLYQETATGESETKKPSEESVNREKSHN